MHAVKAYRDVDNLHKIEAISDPPTLQDKLVMPI